MLLSLPASRWVKLTRQLLFLYVSVWPCYASACPSPACPTIESTPPHSPSHQISGNTLKVGTDSRGRVSCSPEVKPSEMVVWWALTTLSLPVMLCTHWVGALQQQSIYLHTLKTLPNPISVKTPSKNCDCKLHFLNFLKPYTIIYRTHNLKHEITYPIQTESPLFDGNTQKVGTDPRGRVSCGPEVKPSEMVVWWALTAPSLPEKLYPRQMGLVQILK